MKSIQLLIVTLLLSVAFTPNCIAQGLPIDSVNASADTIKLKKIKIHSPTKAAIFSAVVPGLGQVYNRKYWKVPIVYASIGTMLYFGFSNRTSFNKFKTAYGLRIDDDPLTIDEYADVLSADGIKANMDYHQRNRDLSFILAGLFYVFNIVDASVDAHLFNFPKNDNLSFKLEPTLQLTHDYQISQGLKLVINL